MPVDQRILDRFREEFASSKLREADLAARINEHTAALAKAQQDVAGEQGIQSAINDALQQLGSDPL